ncbi:MAG: recombinase family protein [Candidatus Taylorbacteria bacterium]|nr:recombinase family protein [Candidatus Taylorbacteria bacterium]
MTRSAFLAYCRTSTENQKDEKTIELQIESLNKFAHKNNIEIVEWFKDDGVSGALENRPELARMMEYLKNSPNVTGVLIYKLDRLARDLYLQEGLVREFFKLKKQVVSTLEPDLDSDDPFRKAFRQMLGVFAEFEKAMIILRMKSGKRRKAELGGFHGGFVYGYRSKNGQLEVNEQEAQVVREIFHMKKKKRINLSVIARHLNDTGIKTRLRGHWHPSTVKAILENPIYHGKIRFGGNIYDGHHQNLF